jgi:hypothetical protein
MRGLVIALVVLMLGGPVLKHRQVRGTLTRLNFLIDGSQSMQLTDPDMAPARKARWRRILRVRRMGFCGCKS